MIEVNADTACMLYLASSLFVILGIWVIRHFFAKERFSSTISKGKRCCEYCGFMYLEETSIRLSRCPQCSMISE